MENDSGVGAEDFDGESRGVLCGEKSSWGGGTPSACLSLWNCIRYDDKVTHAHFDTN